MAGAAPWGYTDSFTGHSGSCQGSRNGNSSKAGSPPARLVPAGGACLALGSWGTPETQRSPRPSFPLLPVWGGSGQRFPVEPPPAARKSGGGSSAGVRKHGVAELWDKFRGFAMVRAVPPPCIRNGRKRVKSSRARGRDPPGGHSLGSPRYVRSQTVSASNHLSNKCSVNVTLFSTVTNK